MYLRWAYVDKDIKLNGYTKTIPDLYAISVGITAMMPFNGFAAETERNGTAIR